MFSIEFFLCVIPSLEVFKLKICLTNCIKQCLAKICFNPNKSGIGGKPLTFVHNDFTP